MATFDRLCKEIQLFIFAQCITSRDGRRLFDKAAPRVVSLMQVCSSWKEALLASPMIWSEMEIRVDNLTDESVTGRVELWLERSGEALLSFGLIATTSFPEYDEIRDVSEDDMVENEERQGEIYSDLFTLFLEHAHRWKHVELVLPSFPQEPFTGVKVAFPALNSLKIGCRDDLLDRFSYCSCFQLPDWGLEHVSLSPELTELQCSAVAYSKLSFKSYVHLTHLSITSASVHQLFEALVNIPSLQILDTQYIVSKEHTAYYNPVLGGLNTTSDSDPTTDLLVRHAKLQVLAFWAEDHQGSLFLECLTLPALQRLKYSSICHSDMISTLSSFLIRSQCPLTHLDINEWTDYSVPLLVDCLRFVSDTLTELVIRLPEEGDGEADFLELLIVHPHSTGHLCPRITYLSMTEVKHQFEPLLDQVTLSRGFSIPSFKSELCSRLTKVEIKYLYQVRKTALQKRKILSESEG